MGLSEKLTFRKWSIISPFNRKFHYFELLCYYLNFIYVQLYLIIRQQLTFLLNHTVGKERRENVPGWKLLWASAWGKSIGRGLVRSENSYKYSFFGPPLLLHLVNCEIGLRGKEKAFYKRQFSLFSF